MEQQHIGVAKTLQKIKEQTTQLSQVVFVFQPWIEFNNLGPDGFLIPAVPSPRIPRLSLIPLVSIPQKHIESQKDISTNKYVPTFVPYTQPIHTSYLDLLNRYGSSGLVRLTPLSGTVDEALRMVEIFDLMMQPFKEKGLLEDLPEYFGIESPVADQFETRTRRLTMTADKKISSLITHMLISEAEADLLRRCIPILADSAVKAHRHALEPSNGILPQSIDEINKQRKAKMDAVDTFIARQFPSYNADNLLNHKKKQGSNDELIDLLRQALGRDAVPTAAEPADGIDLDALIRSEVEKKVAEALAAIGTAQPAASSESLEEEEEVTTESEFSDGAELDPTRCRAKTGKGTQCKLEPNPKAEFPLYCDNNTHQEQGRAAAEVAVAATA